jgi:uncharacterized membrane protein AbrB (regulator of aidB expression)
MTVLAIIVGADLGYIIVHHLTRVLLVITGAPLVARLMRLDGPMPKASWQRPSTPTCGRPACSTQPANGARAC